MSDTPEENITPEDELKAENEMLKLKIELEHGGQMHGGSNIPPELENEWLKNIMQFEQQFKEAKRVNVFDFIGKPSYSKANELNGGELKKELKRLLKMMEEKGVGIDFICEYNNEIKYRFITEELFQHEMDDMSIPGMMTQFIYEEFHPNHEYDLKRYARELTESLLEREWNEEFSGMSELAKAVTLSGKEYDHHAFSIMAKDFQQSYLRFEISKWEIEKVNFDLEKGSASVNARLSYKATIDENDFVVNEGKARFDFIFSNDYWYINRIEFPGLK